MAKEVKKEYINPIGNRMYDINIAIISSITLIFY